LINKLLIPSLFLLHNKERQKKNVLKTATQHNKQNTVTNLSHYPMPKTVGIT